MLRVKPVACAIAMLLSSSVSAFEIPLYEQIPNTSLQAVSPQPLVLSDEVTLQEGFLHKATALATGNDLIAAYSNNGLTLVRFVDGQYRTLKDYTFTELDIESGSTVRFNSDASVLFTQHYNVVNAFAVSQDGTLTRLAASQSNSIQIHSYGAEGNSYISSVYRFPSYRFVLNSFNPSTNSFTSKELFARPDNVSFVLFDEAKNLLLVGGYSFTTFRYEVQSYKGNASNQFSLISTFELSSGLPDQNNIAYSSATGSLFIADSALTQLQVQADGMLQKVTNTGNFSLPNSYPSQISLSANKLFVLYYGEVHALTLNGSEITATEHVMSQNITNMTQLNGSLLALQSGGLHYYNQGLNSPRLSLQRGEQSLAWLQHDAVLGNQIQLAERFILRTDSDMSELYKADSDGKLSNIKTFYSDEILPQNVNGSGTVAKLTETSLVAARGQLVRLFNFDATAETVTLIKEFDLNKLLPAVNRINYTGSIRVLGSYLLVISDSRMHLFEISDNSLSYLDTAIAGVNGITAIPEMYNSAELNGKLYVFNSGYDAIHELSIENNKFKQKEVFDMPSSGWGSVQVVAAGQKLHVKYGTSLYVFQQLNSKFTLLSLNNINGNSFSYIDNDFALNQYDSESIDILQFDKNSGIPTKIDNLNVGDSWNLQNSFVLGSYLYLQNSDNPAGFKQFMLNRAPDLVTAPAAMQLHEGISYKAELADLVSDKDSGDVLKFSLLTPVSGMALSEQGTFTYDGSSVSASEVAVRVTDSKGLYTDVSLSLLNNKAPALTQAWVAPQLNQNDAFFIDLNEHFADPEGSVLTYEISSTASLSVTAKGIVSGILTTDQDQQLTVVIKDSKGATSSHTLGLGVNAAPVLLGSATLALSTADTVSINLASMFSDIEGQTISFSTSSLPTGLTLSGNTITGKIANAGKFSGLITATDSAGASSQVTLNFEATQPKGSSGSFGWYSVFALIAFTLGRRSRKA